MIQIGGVYTTFCQEEGILLQKYAIEMGGVSRYFSKVSGSGIDATLLMKIPRRKSLEDRNLLKLRSLETPRFHFSKAIKVFGDNGLKCSKCYDRKAKIALRTSKCCNH